MGLVAELYQQVFGARAVKCAELIHENHKRCIFRCDRNRNEQYDLENV